VLTILMPQHKESVKVRRNVKVVAEDVETGETIAQREKNDTTNIGFERLAKLISGEDKSEHIRAMAFGDSEIDPDASQTSLQGNEWLRKDVLSEDWTLSSGGIAEAEIIVQPDEPGTTEDFAELGFFTRTSSGDSADEMFSRVSFASFEKTSELRVRIFYTIAFGNA